jgi:hypothetical protein
MPKLLSLALLFLIFSTICPGRVLNVPLNLSTNTLYWSPFQKVFFPPPLLPSLSISHHRLFWTGLTPPITSYTLCCSFPFLFFFLPPSSPPHPSVSVPVCPLFLFLELFSFFTSFAHLVCVVLLRFQEASFSCRLSVVIPCLYWASLQLLPSPLIAGSHFARQQYFHFANFPPPKINTKDHHQSLHLAFLQPWSVLSILLYQNRPSSFTELQYLAKLDLFVHYCHNIDSLFVRKIHPENSLRRPINLFARLPVLQIFRLSVSLLITASSWTWARSSRFLSSSVHQSGSKATIVFCPWRSKVSFFPLFW